MPNVVTIREAVRRAKADGLPVSEYTLRQWVRTGAVPTRKVGQKALLFYPNLVRYLQCEAGRIIPCPPWRMVPVSAGWICSEGGYIEL